MQFHPKVIEPLLPLFIGAVTATVAHIPCCTLRGCNSRLCATVDNKNAAVHIFLTVPSFLVHPGVIKVSGCIALKAK